MKKYNYLVYVFIFYAIIVLITLLLSGCSTLYVGSRYSSCPSNNKSFFYDRMGVKPSKQFLKNYKQ
jgi:hypothetical protein